MAVVRKEQRGNETIKIKDFLVIGKAGQCFGREAKWERRQMLILGRWSQQ